MIEYRDIICTAVHRATACPSGSSLRAQRGAESGPVSVCVRALPARPCSLGHRYWYGDVLVRWVGSHVSQASQPGPHRGPMGFYTPYAIHMSP